jgi:alpha-galactosidase
MTRTWLTLFLTATLPLVAGRPAVALAGPPTMLTLDALQHSPAAVVTAEGTEAPPGVKVVRTWSGSLCRSRVVNDGKTPVRLREVVLFDVPHAYPPETHLYGEGFTMLSETTGTLARPVDMGPTDRKHYRIPQPDDATVVYGLLTLSPPGGGHTRLAFTSCRRFVGRFHVRPHSLQVVVDTEGLALGPGQSWDLEEVQFGSGNARNALLAALGERIAHNHPPLFRRPVPTGWCSWYCFGPRVRADQVLANLDAIAHDVPALRYVQLDDGYQPAMGDWLETGPAFGGGVQDVLRRIKQKGFEPALWVAPFIADGESHLFRQHPDWFIHDADGKPLSADRVTFAGWRRKPWYALDGTNPAVQKHLEELFRTLRRDWGCTYFKLDANFWGAMHGGRFHDPAATRVEAYRRGMEAIRRGAGDAFLLGCNHPIWPSFGLIHGSRSSGDIKRDGRVFTRTARMNLNRNWQNGRLWWNDPDCVVLTGNLPEDEYHFHAAAVYATGGMLLSGDDLTRIPPQRLALLKKLLPPTGVAAEFEDDSLRVGTIPLEGRTVVCLLNWDDRLRTFKVRLDRPYRVTDIWTGEEIKRPVPPPPGAGAAVEGSLSKRGDAVEVKDVPGHSGRLLLCEPNESPIVVIIQTELGDIDVRLDPAHAPVTTANFLRYVDGGFYNGGRFHRTVRRDNQPDNKVKIEVVQAGINPGRAKDEFPPIELERTNRTGLRHRDGTISMARDGPDTATSDFFICIGDQPELDFGGQRNPDGQGFAAFGRVVGGMDVVRKIQAAPADGQTLKPPVKIRHIVIPP